MKCVGDYRLPDNAKLAGIGYAGCYYYNALGDIYRVNIIDGVQHFRLMPYRLSALKQAVLMHEV
ncbi:hypothetical protein HmCmsJML008_01137 [Escherichia coli]|nr:hypothetical protein HmCmsJML008_01137 [Escherichia coli]GDB53180.1 hypothetical protein HmCmsJML259_04048 [Escherichia coli]